MLILTIRTDKPEAEIGLFEDQDQKNYFSWQAHRELSETIHKKIEEILNSSGKKWKDLNGIVVYKGPGSFTGLRIGLSVANSLAYAQGIPIVGTSQKKWITEGINNLIIFKNDGSVMPEYGMPLNYKKPIK